MKIKKISTVVIIVVIFIQLYFQTVQCSKESSRTISSRTLNSRNGQEYLQIFLVKRRNGKMAQGTEEEKTARKLAKNESSKRFNDK